MFNVGDVIVYSVHGLSKVEDICEKTFSSVTKTYYVLRPLDQDNLTISAPVDSDKVVMQKLLDTEESEEILQSFNQQGISWIENPRQRFNKYQEIVKTGDRKEIAKIANTLMKKNLELSLNNKKLYDQDHKILDSIQYLLFEELAISLDKTVDEINEQVNNMIK
ncbi:CarD family transcriptional regulator [Tenuibacillus multivorans]|uniref:CarD family transcriptional regulator n=1 Tax=Tenuibacillus multivorans TaxID=237069 RepID=A0A1G9W7S0_9BACI|nr:CarD family transcriptional regulator [Tenuibacillus multivorans]GEL76346.1 hypothetical protein TMU01_05810 [Tenuibacillus multivorans]SDM80572.1 CarD family transcriptional regulator [Tenuibacillus multivorans]